MRRSTLTVSALILVAWGANLEARADETGLEGPMYYTQVEGDFVTGGSSSRIRDGAIVGDSVGVSLSGIPVGATVVQAFANWSFLGNSTPATSEITLDGTSVTGTLAGFGANDLVWGHDFGMSYTADVSSLVTEDGLYEFTGVTDDDDLEWIGEGVSIVAIYRMDGLANKAVHVYHGYTSTTSGEAEATLDFGAAYEGGEAHFFANALDGQEIFSDDFYVNGGLASADFGLAGVGNAFQGDLGPGLRDYNYYDHAEGDASAYMGVGDLSLGFKTEGYWNEEEYYTDAIGHSFSAVSFAVVPEPAILLGLAGALGALTASRKRIRP